MMEAEVVVVGAGPAGIAAATAAAGRGCKTVLLDDNHAAGGQIWRQGLKEEAGTQKQKALARLRASGAQLEMGWQVFDAPQRGVLRAMANGRVTTVRYRQLVIATGARERFLPFPGWTLPGVFGAGGLQALVQGGYDIAGKKVVVAGSGPLLLAVAAHLKRYGATIVSIIEQAEARQLARFAAFLLRQPEKLWQGAAFRAHLRGTPYRTGCWPVGALGTTHVTGIELTNGTQTWEQACDLIACGFHLVPNTELAALLGCEMRGAFVAVNDQQQTSVQHVYCAGEPTGIAGLESALLQGTAAGLACAGDLSGPYKGRAAAAAFAAKLEQTFSLRAELRQMAKADTILCRCEDVRWERLAACTSWSEAKLQTRCGMGPCQGRICGPATQTLFGWQPGSVRPPLYPVPVSGFLNDDYDLSNLIAHEEKQ